MIPAAPAYWTAALALGGGAYAASRYPWGRRQQLTQLGVPRRLPPAPPGVDPTHWSRAMKGLVTYGIVTPQGQMLVDPLGESVRNDRELITTLKDSRVPLYHTEALDAARLVPVSYLEKENGKLTRKRLRAGSKRSKAYTNPPMRGPYVTEKAVSDVFWSRTTAAKKKSRPTPFIFALSTVLAQYRVGYVTGSPRDLLGTSTKIVKGLKVGVLTRVMYLSAETEAGINMCPRAGGCRMSCLGWSTGQMTFNTSEQSRVGKTLYWYFDTPGFLTTLDKQIKSTVKSADKKGFKAAIRLNGSSDVRWEMTRGTLAGGEVNGRSIVANNPETFFYDYTKWPASTRKFRRNGGPQNYHIVYSFDEKPDSQRNAQEYLEMESNSAVVIGPRLDDSTFAALKPLNQEIIRITGDPAGACALPDGPTSVEAHVNQLRYSMFEIAQAAGVTKNSSKAASFHVLWPGMEFEERPSAPTHPRVWQQIWNAEKQRSGSINDEMFGRALLAYEKKVDAMKKLPWNNDPNRRWLFGNGVVDADQTDIRFKDPPSTWNVLYAKGPAAWDVTGFVVRVDEAGVPYFLEDGDYRRRELEGQSARRGRANRYGRRLGRPNYYRYRR